MWGKMAISNLVRHFKHAVLTLLGAVLLVSSAVQMAGAAVPTLKAVTDLSITQVTKSSLQIAWAIPANEVSLSGITVNLTNSQGAVVTEQNLSPSATSTEVANLTPDTNFTVTVIATDTNFPPNTAAATVSAKTLKNPASAVSGFRAVPSLDVNASMSLTWSPPSYVGSGLSGYTVTCSPSCSIPSQPSAAATSLTVTGLSTTKSYTFTIVANTSDGQSGASSTAVGNFAPTSPIQFVGSQQTMSTVLLTWSAPSYAGSGLSGYTVSCSPACSIPVQPSASATSLLVTGLTYNQSYSFAILANATDLQVSPTVTTTATTSSVIGPIQNLVVTAPTSTSLSASWNAPAGSANYVTFYKAYCAQGLTSCGSATVGATANPSVSFQTSQQYPIIPTLSYTIYVLAYAVNGSSSPSYVSASVSTPVSTNPAPNAVTNARSTSQTTTSISISWSAPNNLDQAGVLNGYTVTCSPACTIPNQPGPAATSLTIENLNPATRYTISVVANSAAMKNSAASTFTADTNYLPVTNFVASSPSTNSIRLSWTPPVAGSVAIKGYVVSCTPSCSIANQPGAAATSFTITGLNPGVSYNFAIAVVGSDDQQSTTVTASNSTNYLPPNPAESFTATAQTSTSVLLSWVAPSLVGSGLLGYTISCLPACTIASQPNSSARSLLVSGLTEGQSYTFSIVARSTDTQSSSASRAYSVGVATALSSSQVTSSSVSLAWTAPSTIGGGLSIRNYLFSCSPSTGSSVSGITTSPTATVTGLESNLAYSCVVSTSDENGNMSVVSSPVTFTTMHVAPGSATGLVATTESTTSIRLTWTAPSEVGAGLNGYTVSCTPTCRIDSQPGARDVSLLITGLTPGQQYSFVLITLGTDGQQSTSITASARTIPSAPTRLVATALSTSSVLLTWTAPSQVGSGLSGYSVTCTPSCTIASQPGSNATSFTVTGLLPGTTYSFSIVANATGTQSSAAATASVTTNFAAPGAPSNFAATTQSRTSILLTWAAPSEVGSGLSGFQVSCSPSCTIANQPSSDATSLLVSGLTAGTLYNFSIYSKASDTQQSSSANSSARTQYVAPGPVTDITVSSSGMTQVQLNWRAPVQMGAGLAGYTVSCSPVCVVASQPTANATSLLVTGLSPNTSYVISVVVRALDSQTSTSASSSSVTTSAAPGPLVNPTKVVTKTTAIISWAPPVGSGSAISGYIVSCAPTCGAPQVLLGSATSVELASLTVDTAYTVSIVAQAATGETTTTVSLRTLYAAPGAVTGLTATAQSTSSVLVSWTAAAANGSATLSGYTVTCTPSCTIASQPNANATSLTVTGLSAGTSYTFSVVANASDSQRSSAATASVRTNYAAPGAVTGLTATQISAGTIGLSWSAPKDFGSGLESYRVTYSAGGALITKMTTSPNIKVAGLSKATYVFTVVAIGKYWTTSAISTVRFQVK